MAVFGSSPMRGACAVVTFATTTDALAVQAAAKGMALSGRLAPVPLGTEGGETAVIGAAQDADGVGRSHTVSSLTVPRRQKGRRAAFAALWAGL